MYCSSRGIQVSFIFYYASITIYEYSFFFSCSYIHCLVNQSSGVVPFYKDFLESLYEFLDGNASITGMSTLVSSLFSVNPLSLILFFCPQMVKLVCFFGSCVAIGQISQTTKVYSIL